MRYLTLQNLRRLYAFFFVSLFIVLLLIADFRHLKGYEVALFLQLDPLVAVSTFLTSWTIYRGLILSLIIIIATLVFGRFFCSWLCPLGILNQWLAQLFNRRRAGDDNRLNAYHPSHRLKYYLLALLLMLAVGGTLQTGIFDPISLLTRSVSTSLLPALWHGNQALYLTQPLFHGGTLIIAIFLAILLANRLLSRFWCRTLCPLGGLLGLLAGSALLRIRRDVEKCTDCQRCRRHCHGACDPHGKLRQSECLLCMNCLAACPEKALHYGLPRPDSSVHAPLDVNRRRLLETVAAGAVLAPLLTSVANARTIPQPHLIRPPGSLAEADFLRRCLRCGACLRACPTNGLQPALLEAGFEGLWTPMLLPKIGYCADSCVLCGQVCPTGAITPLTPARKLGVPPFQEPIRIGTAFHDRNRCLPWAMDIQCIVCEEVCPRSPKAIWFEEVERRTRDGRTVRLKRPRVDPRLCVGCGICEYKCPVRDLPGIRVSSVGESRSRHNQMILGN